MFTELLDRIKYDFISTLSKIEIATPEMVAQHQAEKNVPSLQYSHQEFHALTPDETEENAEHQPFTRQNPKVGRNDPCYCGSGKKFKVCHGKL